MPSNLKQNIIKRKISLVFVILVGFTLLLYAPFELLIPNIEDINIPFALYAWIPIAVWVIVSTGAFILVCALPDKIYSIYEFVLFAIGFVFYIQGNFLNINTGIMNGDAVHWDRLWGKILLNGLILQILIIVLAIIWKYKKQTIRKIALFISVVLIGAQLVSLIFIVFSNWDAIHKPNRERMFSTQKDICSIGGEGTNVVWFLLDMYDNEYFHKLSVLQPELLDGLDGFTYFSNYTGTYPSTDYAMASLMTGRLFLNESSMDDWVSSMKDEGIYLDELAADGYHMYGYSPYDFTLPPIALENQELGKVKLKSNIRFAIQIYKLVLNKYGPDLIKPLIWMDGTEFDYWKGYTTECDRCTSDNIRFKELIEGTELEVTPQKDFRFIYLDGTHYPYHTDENAERVGRGDATDIDAAIGVLKIVEMYLDKLKETNTYDNTVVIITADHGYYRHGTLTCPVMLVKPANAHGIMVENTAPVCQLDFGATVLQLAGIDNYSDYGESIFDIEEGSERERFFYQYYLKESALTTRRLIQYKIDSEDNKTDNFHLTGVEYTENGQLIDHYQYCRTCNGEERDDDWDKEIDWKYTIHKPRANYPKAEHKYEIHNSEE